MNGDIYNYKNIIAKAKSNHGLTKDDNLCTTDCLAASAYLLGKPNISLATLSEMISDLDGSYAVTIQHSDTPEKIFIIKKGIQGLYLGFSYDGVMFASDVYGLVESCKYFVPVDTETALELSASQQANAFEPNIGMLDLRTNKLNKLHFDDLKITNITTRDIDKGSYKTFFRERNS